MNSGRLVRLIFLPAKFFRTWFKDPEARLSFRVNFLGVSLSFAIIFPVCLIIGVPLEVSLLCLTSMDPENIIGSLAWCPVAWMVVPEAVVWVNLHLGWPIPLVALIALVIAVRRPVSFERDGNG